MGDNIKLDNDKLNKSLEVKKDLPEVPRTETGAIDLEAITIEIDEKGNRIIADDIFNAYFRELPEKVINQSKTWRSTSSGGKIKILGNDPADAYIHKKGAEASNAMQAQRRSYKEIVDFYNRQKVPKFIERELEGKYELPEGTTLQEAQVIALNYKTIVKEDTSAFLALRDTAGEKPTENINASVQMIPDQEKLLEEFNRIITE